MFTISPLEGGPYYVNRLLGHVSSSIMLAYEDNSPFLGVIVLHISFMLSVNSSGFFPILIGWEQGGLVSVI